jgi:hypothetical protein
MRALLLWLLCTGVAVAAPAWRFPAAQRVVGLGDVHGDFEATRAALRLADLIDGGDHWIGGSAVLVQTGDVLDRGDGERQIMELLARLQGEASKAGGRVILLSGNHELMNAQGDLRYVTPGGLSTFADLAVARPGLESAPPAYRGRLSAFLPGGAFALRLAEQPLIVVVGDTVFAHGGVLPAHVDRIEAINAGVAAWLRGVGPPPKADLGLAGPVWTRDWSKGDLDAATCARLDEVLVRLKVKRMVVGHTVQRRGITQACEGKVWRIDVGMAKHYGGRPAVLEITPAGVVVRTGAP